MKERKREKRIGNYIIELKEIWEETEVNQPILFKESQIAIFYKSDYKKALIRKRYYSYGHAREVFFNLNNEEEIKEFLSSQGNSLKYQREIIV